MVFTIVSERFAMAGKSPINNTTVDPRLMKLNERGNDSFERRKKIAQGFIGFMLTNSTLGVSSC